MRDPLRLQCVQSQHVKWVCGGTGLRLAHPIICRHDCQRWKRDGSVLTAVPDFDECTFASSAYRLQQNLTVFRIPRLTLFDKGINPKPNPPVPLTHLPGVKKENEYADKLGPKLLHSRCQTRSTKAQKPTTHTPALSALRPLPADNEQGGGVVMPGPCRGI